MRRSIQSFVFLTGAVSGFAISVPDVAAVQVEKSEQTTAEPASAESAAAVLDLRTFELPADARNAGMREVGNANYETPAAPEASLEFLRRSLTMAGWKEFPGSMTTDAYATAMFGKSGFFVNCSASANGREGAEAGSYVTIVNFGNVSVKSLPVIDNARSEYLSDVTGIYVTRTPVEKAAEETAALFQKAGWEPYGRNDVSAEQKHFNFKRNAIQVSVMISVAPAQQGQTAITCSSLLLSCDLPAPEFAEDLSFVSYQKTLTFGCAQEFQAVSEFYETRLARNGWKPTTEDVAVSTDEFKRQTGVQVFRNKAGDSISLDLLQQDDRCAVTLTHRTKQEFADQIEASRKAAEELVAKRNAEEQEEAAERRKQEQQAAEERAELEMEIESTAAGVEGLAGALIADALKDIPGKGGSTKKQNPGRGRDQGKKGTDGTVSIPVPAEATVSRVGDMLLKIEVPDEQTLATIRTLVDDLLESGWTTEDDSELEDESGSVELKKQRQRVRLSWDESEDGETTIQLIGIGIKLKAVERASDENLE